MTYAFPHNTVVVDKEGGVKEHHRGITVRDYFAAKAMQAYLSGHDRDSFTFTEWALTSYAMADAMMVAREK
jgi:hypothetical protein